MSPAPRLAIFLLALAALFGAGTAAGSLLDPDGPGGEEGTATMDAHGAGEESATDTHVESEAGHGEMEMAADAVRGLSDSANGFNLEIDDPDFARGATEELRFRIVDEAGTPVTEFDVEHERRMHAIVVRRDLTGFQHLHPEMAADGTWEVPLRLAEPGEYSLFADFSSGEQVTTLAGDLAVAGGYDPAALPAPRTSARSDGGYDVRLSSDAAEAGEPAELGFEVTKDGEPVTVQPYLGAGGHLVALRQGDLAFLHVHPLEAGGGHGDGAGHPHGGEIAFEATLPTPGAYRLFLQFKVGGRVETAAFTEEVR